MGGCLAGLTPEEKNHLDQSKLIDKNNRDDQLERTMVFIDKLYVYMFINM
jgi:hypothetical protein